MVEKSIERKNHKNGGHFVLQQRLGAAQAICLDQKLLYSVIGWFVETIQWHTCLTFPTWVFWMINYVMVTGFWNIWGFNFTQLSRAAILWRFFIWLFNTINGRTWGTRVSGKNQKCHNIKLHPPYLYDMVPGANRIKNQTPSFFLSIRTGYRVLTLKT